MIGKSINYIRTGFNHPFTQIILKILSITSIISTCITLGTLTFYSIGYSFLYGYYFVNLDDTDASLIKLLLNNVPFSFYSVIITSAMFIVVVSFFVILLWNLGIAIKHFINKETIFLGLARIIIVIFLFFIFHFSLTSFFLGNFFTSSKINSSFLTVWIGPLIVAILIYFFLQIAKGIVSALSGMVYGILILSFLASIFDWHISSAWFIIVLLFGIPFSYFEKFISHIIYRIILAIPFSLVVIMLLSGIVSIFYPKIFPFNIFSWIASLALILILIIPFQNLIGKLAIEKRTSNSNELSDEEIESNKKSNKKFIDKFEVSTILTLFVIVVFSFMSTTIPDIAKYTGTVFRMTTPKVLNQNIYYGESDSPQLINVELVANKDDIYYISDSNAQMIIIKTDKFRIEPSTSNK